MLRGSAPPPLGAAVPRGGGPPVPRLPTYPTPAAAAASLARTQWARPLVEGLGAGAGAGAANFDSLGLGGEVSSSASGQGRGHHQLGHLTTYPLPGFPQMQYQQGEEEGGVGWDGKREEGSAAAGWNRKGEEEAGAGWNGKNLAVAGVQGQDLRGHPSVAAAMPAASAGNDGNRDDGSNDDDDDDSGDDNDWTDDDSSAPADDGVSRIYHAELKRLRSENAALRSQLEASRNDTANLRADNKALLAMLGEPSEAEEAEELIMAQQQPDEAVAQPEAAVKRGPGRPRLGAAKKKKVSKWKTSYKTFEQRLQEFVEYRQTYGHPYVPQNHPGGLGAWVQTQRLGYKYLVSGKKGSRGNRAVTPEKVKLLEDAGFAWDGKAMLSGTKRRAIRP